MTPRALARGIGKCLLVAGFLLLTAMPLVDFLGRPLAGFHIPGSATYTQQLTFFLTFIGGLAATLAGKHLTLSTAGLLPGVRARREAEYFSSCVAACVTAILTYAGVCVVIAERVQGRSLTFGLPVWISESVMPLGLGLISLTYVWKSSSRLPARLWAGAIACATFVLGIIEPSGIMIWILTAILMAAMLVGSPVFAAMSGLALIFFWGDGTPVSAVTAEIYRLVGSPNLPAIPLLTATGFVLAESNSPLRLVNFFRALLGFIPGGVALLVGAVCALFTALTGGSGVTIIALGGLVYPILLKGGYSESFSLGLVTAAGSLGLLFPPCLAVVLYGVVANTPADQLFIAGFVPGTLLLMLVAIYSIKVSLKAGIERQPFRWHELLASARIAKWDLSIPAAMAILFGTGLASMLETSAFACAYTIVISCFIHRDLHPLEKLPGTLVKAAALVGAIFILLSCAMGLTGYLVDAQIPDRLLEVVKERIHSPLFFLLTLNIVLLVLGSVLEIFSAIIVLTPLVIPLGVAFGVHPVHLGIIFLANLQVGFLFPPVGLNLLIASSCFGKPMGALYRDVIPFLLILGLGVLLITYVPALSIGVLRLLGRL
ncbi:MAG TPA: TRAP transporter large permease subunit [Syntrophobacteraceae bacterium]|nr:TRAP transporter large permease subunit [Syntrophobacteraceae bacterium]